MQHLFRIFFLIPPWNIPIICPRYAWNMPTKYCQHLVILRPWCAETTPKICPEYTQNIPKIYLEYAHEIFPKSGQISLKICPKSAQNVPKICLECVRDMPRIYPKFAGEIQKMYVFSYLIDNSRGSHGPRFDWQLTVQRQKHVNATLQQYTTRNFWLHIRIQDHKLPSVWYFLVLSSIF